MPPRHQRISCLRGRKKSSSVALRRATSSLSCLVALVLFFDPGLTSAGALPSWAGEHRTVANEAGGVMKLAQRRKRKGKAKVKTRRRKAPPAAKQPQEPPPALELTPEPAPPSDDAGAPVLDLSDLGADDAADATSELLKGGDATKSESEKQEDVGGFDFGSESSLEGAIEFGGDLEGFDLGSLDINSEERQRFDTAMALISDEKYVQAALEFRYFLEDEAYANFHQESEYQLAKALYRLNFLDPALERFKKIIDAGPNHRRYRKSIEWLFFLSRKMEDETPVLAELARFRNVTFPKAYQNEYRYLLSKYLFAQAERFEVGRLQKAQLEQQKRSKAGTFDFSAVADAIGGDGFDFGGGGGDGGFDFGGGGDGGFDFGGGGDGGFDFGGGGDGGFDFGGGADAGIEGDENIGPMRAEGPSSAQEAIRQGLDFVTAVEKDSKFYPQAKYLEGLLYYLEGGVETKAGGESAHQQAILAFQEVVRVLNPRTGARLDPRTREMAFLSLARIHYGYRQFDKAVYYYDMIDRNSRNWLTALFEASWAYYRRGDFEKALGNLLTLHSPFFEREYFPESQIVKAIIFFEACRYQETRGIVDMFLSRFTQVMKEIERIAESKEAPELLYDRIVQLQGKAGDDDDVTARLVSLALQDAEIHTARRVVQQVEQQLERWQKMNDEFKQSRLGNELHESLKDLSVDKAKEAGEVTRAKFEQELYNLKSLLAQALRIKIEVARSERLALERRMRGQEDLDALVPATPRTVVDDERLYWPYDGEYWRDELGTYELDFSMCRQLAAR